MDTLGLGKDWGVGNLLVTFVQYQARSFCTLPYYSYRFDFASLKSKNRRVRVCVRFQKQNYR